MKKYLLKTFFRINRNSVILTFILCFIFQNFVVPSGEKLRNCYMPLFTELIISFLSFFIALTSITIFLNLIKKINQNNTFIILSFFLLPIITSIIIVFNLIDENDNYIFLFIFALLLPVWLSLIWEYFKFNRITNNL